MACMQFLLVLHMQGMLQPRAVAEVRCCTLMATALISILDRLHSLGEALRQHCRLDLFQQLVNERPL
jgi:hypothetical protein